MHSLTMDGSELLKALMDRDGLNSNSLAVKLRNKSMQSHVYRYLKGIAKQPKLDTLRPIADHFGVPVAAFYDSALAEQVAAEQGLIEGAPATRVPAQPRAALTEADQLADALEVLTKALLKSDENARIAVEPLLASMANEPEKAGQKSRLILRLLTTDTVQDTPTENDRPGHISGDLGILDLGDRDNGRSDRVATAEGRKR